MIPQNLDPNWQIPTYIETTTFDWNWRPDPYDPPFIHQFGTQWQKTGGPRYVVPGATQVKYHDMPRAYALVNAGNRMWRGRPNIEFDFSWHHDETEPPFIYQFGTQWQKTGGPRYVVKGATQIKYVEYPKASALHSLDNWQIPEDLDVSNFDFSWHPDYDEPPMIYQFGTQWQKTGGPRYVVPGATDVKYVDFQRATRLPSKKNWKILTNIDDASFDWSWHPDDTDPPLTYVFGNNLYTAEEMPTVEYCEHNATDAVKYVHDIVATLQVDMSRWQIPDDIDTSSFDWNWMPDPKQPPMIYQWGTQWQKTGGPRYVVPGATEVKYMSDRQAIALPKKSNWRLLTDLDIAEFDWSWHPDDTEPPFVYQFGNNLYTAEEMPTVEYIIDGATEVKYVNTIKAQLAVDMTRWQIPDDIDTSGFDWNWMPDPKQPPMIYQWGTQWQKTGGPRYVVPGATEVKYIDSPRATKLPCNKNWQTLLDIDQSQFDWSWHPDDTEPPYVYVFGNNIRTAEETPTVLYTVPGGQERKYCHHQVAQLVYRPLDIIYLSNGEADEERRFDDLCLAANRHVMWVRGIKGRENALRRAAQLSTTDWFFLVPGKLKVDPKFDFTWQPNRFHDPKHYIFYATNPVNGLKYGHMAMVAYNRQLVLDTVDYGLDFTMSKPHDVIEINSGTAEFNLDPLMTWRTAFREAIKLKVASIDGDKQAKTRLAVWTKIANGLNAEYSIAGALDGVKYYKETNGDPDLLQLSFDWDWLETRFQKSMGK